MLPQMAKKKKKKGLRRCKQVKDLETGKLLGRAPNDTKVSLQGGSRGCSNATLRKRQPDQKADWGSEATGHGMWAEPPRTRNSFSRGTPTGGGGTALPRQQIWGFWPLELNENKGTLFKLPRLR